MNRQLASVLAVSLAAAACGQTMPDQAPRIGGTESPRWYQQWSNPYSAKQVSPVPMENSGRIESLMRAGLIYLSLQDAIALAIENNLDVEFQRFNPPSAQSDVLRAKGGGTTRGLSLTVAQPPPGLGGPSSPLLTSTGASSIIGATSVPVNVSTQSAISTPSINLAITPGTFSTGTALPIYDAVLSTQVNAAHQTTPQSNTLLTGTNLLVARTETGSAGVTQAFSSGTAVSLNFSSTGQSNNAIRSTLNPFTNSALGLTITQPLLRGFGMTVNRRFIRIATNEERIADFVFRQQLIETVSGVARLYWDLVALRQDLSVKQQTLALAQKLEADNRLQVQQGTMAPIDVVRAQAQVAAAQQDLVNSQGFLREQELILKNVLTRRGTADPRIRDARIIPTDSIPTPPPAEVVQPVQDLVSQAFKNRPDLASAGLQITNAQLSLDGSRNLLLPDVSLVGTFQNTALAGQVNPLLSQGGIGGAPVVPSPAFLGGFGTTLEQIFRRNYPTYGVGLLVNLPLRNRVAQADVVRDEIQLRQTQVRRQLLENQVRLEVEDALIALDRTRAAYEAAAQTRVLQEQSLAAEQEKYAVGLSTTFLIIQYQSYLAQARSTEVAAQGAYAKARTALQRATGTTLQDYSVSVEDSYRGRVARPPAPLPAQ